MPRVHSHFRFWANRTGGSPPLVISRGQLENKQRKEFGTFWKSLATQMAHTLPYGKLPNLLSLGWFHYITLSQIYSARASSVNHAWLILHDAHQKPGWQTTMAGFTHPSKPNMKTWVNPTIFLIFEAAKHLWFISLPFLFRVGWRQHSKLRMPMWKNKHALITTWPKKATMLLAFVRYL